MYSGSPYPASGASAHSVSSSTGAGSESSLRLDRELKLATSRADMEKERVKAEVYALLQTTDRLEALYGRGAISKDDYETHCRDLIHHFKLQEDALMRLCGMSSKEFIEKYKVDMPFGEQRLLVDKMPSTSSMETGRTAGSNIAALPCGAAFVTALDAADMDHASKEQLWDPISAVLSTINDIYTLPHDFPPKAVFQRWVKTIQDMPFDVELDADQRQQLKFDLQTSYTLLTDFLSGKRRE